MIGSPGDAASSRARVGFVLFAVYLVVYATFVGLCAFDWTAMGGFRLGGVNLAVLYGFGLIALALILALLYDRLCRAIDLRIPAAGTRDEEAS